MERLIDLLFSNIWLLIALYWLFLFLFSGRKREEERRTETRRPGPLAPPPVARDPVPPAGAPVGRPARPTPPTPPAPPAPAHPPRLSAAPPQMPAATALRNEAKAGGPRPVRMGREGAARPAEAPQAPLLSPDAVVAGILWAQVLGAPRAKAPHPLAKLVTPRDGEGER